MLSLFNSFACGFCLFASITCFTDGDVVAGFINIGLAILNGLLAIANRE